MKKVLFPSVFALLLSTVLMDQASWAARAYVSNEQEIILRSGPSEENRVVKSLKPGSSVEVLSTKHDWSRVRVKEGPGQVREGWVLSSLLSDQAPEEIQAKLLEKENAAIKEKMAGMEKEKGEIAKREQELQDKLNKLQASYDELKAGASDFIKLKEEFDAAKAALSQTQSLNQALLQENEDLKLSQKIRWFLAGAGVLLGGWVLGIMTGRQQRKRRQPYYM